MRKRKTLIHVLMLRMMKRTYRVELFFYMLFWQWHWELQNGCCRIHVVGDGTLQNSCCTRKLQPEKLNKLITTINLTFMLIASHKWRTEKIETQSVSMYGRPVFTDEEIGAHVVRVLGGGSYPMYGVDRARIEPKLLYHS
ncbi:hypothetical protein Dimus_030695 [Dionaea muscipula]